MSTRSVTRRQLLTGSAAALVTTALPLRVQLAQASGPNLLTHRLVYGFRGVRSLADGWVSNPTWLTQAAAHGHLNVLAHWYRSFFNVTTIPTTHLTYLSNVHRQGGYRQVLWRLCLEPRFRYLANDFPNNFWTPQHVVAKQRQHQIGRVRLALTGSYPSQANITDILLDLTDASNPITTSFTAGLSLGLVTADAQGSSLPPTIQTDPLPPIVITAPTYPGDPGPLASFDGSSMSYYQAQQLLQTYYWKQEFYKQQYANELIRQQQIIDDEWTDRERRIYSDLNTLGIDATEAFAIVMALTAIAVLCEAAAPVFRAGGQSFIGALAAGSLGAIFAKVATGIIVTLVPLAMVGLAGAIAAYLFVEYYKKGTTGLPPRTSTTVIKLPAPGQLNAPADHDYDRQYPDFRWNW